MTGCPPADDGSFFEEVAGKRIECRWHPAANRDAPTLVFLHDGIGSAASWRDYPSRLAAETGCSALVYSRVGCGWSSAREEPFGVDYMHREAFDILPALLDARGIEAPVLIGQSDGASIALLYAGGTHRAVRGLILEAPHVFVEPLTVASIERAKDAFLRTDLRTKLARYHSDAEAAFFGWNDVWLLPAFRSWDIRAWLKDIPCPILAIQGEDDEYGTLAQIDAIERAVAGTFEKLILPGCGHTPHRDQAERTLQAMHAFVAAL